MRTIKLVIEYDGTHYLGWQVPANGQTIQGVISRLLETSYGESSQLIGSGRTDEASTPWTGRSLQDRSRWMRTTFQKALNSLLPEDIVIEERGG